jgi:hypothetical protein
MNFSKLVQSLYPPVAPSSTTNSNWIVPILNFLATASYGIQNRVLFRKALGGQGVNRISFETR